MKNNLPILLAVALSVMAQSVWGGVITAQGSVAALTDISQIAGVLGVANFDEGPTSGAVPGNTYAASGMVFHNAALTSILSGVTTGGNSTSPVYRTGGSLFPGPIAGGGSQTGNFNRFAGAATFTVPVTQVGLTASRNGPQYLTAWDLLGTLLGQVSWAPSSDSAFVGIDTLGVQIGMVTYGNDDLLAGQTYNIGGVTIFSDSWIWASGVRVQVPEPTTLALLGLGLAGLGFTRQRKSVRPDD